MKAIVCTRYGPPEVLQLREVEKPAPGDNEVLIRIHATPVTAADCLMRKGVPFFGRLVLGLMKPKRSTPGVEFSGKVEATGRNVKLFKAGDRVFGSSDTTFGAHAEYVCLPEDGLLAAIPENITFEEAAPVCDGALTAMNFLRNVAKVHSGHKVLIVGASGGVGTSAVQLARCFGAEVTGVCSTSNLEMVKSLGADKVIDYTTVHFTAANEKFDIILDTAGKSSFSSCKGSLAPEGVYLSTVLGLPILMHTLATSKSSGKKAKFSATGLRPLSERRVLLGELMELIETGKIKTVMDRHYPLERIVEAHRYVENGHKKGNVVITL